MGVNRDHVVKWPILVIFFNRNYSNVLMLLTSSNVFLKMTTKQSGQVGTPVNIIEFGLPVCILAAIFSSGCRPSESERRLITQSTAAPFKALNTHFNFASPPRELFVPQITRNGSPMHVAKTKGSR